ncbi:uncharacterized protein BXZ73DRAFT_90040 [Epithele typhae]|uniref:uncharacterized protein n=1 Tax=Epithele typhae TaxID=378194 RepID=UPI002008451F|nr:uncharacterized protein BXZ73DRAFT_90040 [Epithele typhae]KAH9932114.1 hypothetical protein BXZ73DRAFT_90040 [Epithele typhae]
MCTPISPPSSFYGTLEELHLLTCSLLPGELIVFTDDAARWQALLDAYDEPLLDAPDMQLPPARFHVKLSASSAIWFDVELPRDYRPDPDPDPEDEDAPGRPTVLVKGDHLGRAEQEQWQHAVADSLEAVRSSEYPAYDLISTHLLPRLHASLAAASAAAHSPDPQQPRATLASDPAHPLLPPTLASSLGLEDEDGGAASPSYHALLVSHHLRSPHKRRALAQWAHAGALRGFAKVGHPGVIYCAGARGAVEDFVGRVRAMQWLALRLRFVEPEPELARPGSGGAEATHGEWKEFEKVGEVVEEMRRLGREKYVVEMGIGSAGNGASTK